MSDQNGNVPNETEEGYEEALVTLDNVDWVAQRSGKNDQDLRRMLLVRDMQGKELRVKYKVVGDGEPAPSGLNRKIKRKLFGRGRR